jgi:signal transduction histidine kinase
MDPTALAKANEEIYKRNFELSIRNKTLSILRTLYTLTMSTLEINETAQRIVDTITQELNFSATLITLVDKDHQVIRPLAISQTPQIKSALDIIGKPFDSLELSLKNDQNLIVNAVLDGDRKITSNMLDILDPLLTQEPADKIENLTNIKTLLIYPLSIENRRIGALIVGIPKSMDDLSRSDNESLDELINLISIALDRAQLHSQLKAANEKLKELDKLKDEFVSTASHELRTPMTAIKSYVWLVQNDKAGPITDTTRRYLDIVFNSTERLIHLVNDMLDISRIESGKTQLRPEQVDYPDLINQLNNEFSARATERHMAWSVNLPSALPQITLDKEKILQVLENLVGNAFKFTPDGGRVTVAVSADKKYLSTSISDTGPGISQTDISHLFTKFTRLGENINTYSQPGTGLGLYLCKQYVEMHQGKILIDSVPGQGSTFTFTLPLS